MQNTIRINYRFGSTIRTEVRLTQFFSRIKSAFLPPLPLIRIPRAFYLLAILVTSGFSQLASAQTYYIYSWGIGTSTGNGYFSTFQAAGQVAVEVTNINYNEGSNGYSISSCLPGGPTSGPGIMDVVCNLNQGGQYAAAVSVEVGSSPSSRKDVGTCPTCRGQSGDPIVMSIGNKILDDTDYVGGGESPLRFHRFYNSSPVALSSSFFQSWAHTYSASINSNSPTQVFVSRDDGKAYTFNLVSGVWTSDADVKDTLAQLTSGGNVTGWQYSNSSNDSLETYDKYGNLSSIEYRDGKIVTLAYANGASAPTFPGQLTSAADAFGNKLTFNLSGSSLTMTAPNGGYTYSLGSASQLASVTYPDSSARSFLYNESAYNGGGTTLTYSLTGVVDENNSRFDSTWYDSSGNAIKTSLAGSVEQYALTNTLDGSGRIQSVSITDPLGAVRGRGYTSSVGRNRLSSSTAPASTGQPAGSEAFSFDANGNVSQSTDPNGNLTCSVYDLTRNLETGRAEGLAPGSSCPSNISTYVPSAGTAQRKTLTQYHSIWHLPIKRAEPLKIITWVYNGDGGVYCAPTTAKVGSNPIGVVCSHTEQATTDATGGAGFSASASGSPRIWTYTYNGFGQVLTAKSPRTDVNDTTTYTYNSCTTGGACGQVHAISNSLGHVTTFNTYNSAGQPLTITDPNGTVTTLTYDARQRLTSRQVGTETTGYAYYLTGLLKTVTLPDSSTVTYTHDAAHRLTKIADGLGNYIQYTLDAMGNRTATKMYNASATLMRSHTDVFNDLGTLYQDVNAAGTTEVTTTYGYDAQGNQTSAAAPLSRNSSSTFDALNRLTQITDPASGITKYGYDARDNVVSVSDPRSLGTTYTIDGFGETTQIISPDTGTSTKTFDLNGNVKTTTDARGAVGTYTYDALNRVTQLAFTDQTIAFSYDQGTDGIGHLTGSSDSYHSMSWTYDALGRVNGKTQTIGTVAKSIGYTYANGDLTTVTTPSGQTVTYAYNNHRISSIKINGTTLLSAVTYDPFGPATGWTWGNGTTSTRSFDQDGSPAQIVTAGVTNTYTVDSATRITGLSDSGLSSNSFTFGYDALDRVTSGTSSATTRGYTYDGNGNWISETGSQHFTTTISTTSNQLTATAGQEPQSFSYDAAGNTTGFNGQTFTYYQRGRISQLTGGSGSTSYHYNGLGEMIEKTGIGGTQRFFYDESGHMVTEYGASGSLIEETIWMGDTPVAIIQPSGTTVAVFYIHTDHLNTPRKITRPSDNGLMWRWDPDTYGLAQTNNNPAGLGNFTYNLRFAGQYFHNELWLHTNYYRTYNPQQGRYLESDPMGLNGGSYSTYVYADGNAISNSDPSGQEAVATMSQLGWGINPNSDPPCEHCKGSDRYTFTTHGVCAGSTDPMCSLGMQAAGIPGPYGSKTWVVSKSCIVKAALLLEPIKLTAVNSLLRRLPVALSKILASNYLTAALFPATLDVILNECSCEK